jgi:hypothetical protein
MSASSWKSALAALFLGGTMPVAITAAETEVLVFDWNEVITKPGRFIEGKTQWRPKNPDVRANTDWTKPPHYANGTYHIRVLLRSMKKHEDFKLLFNHWQVVDGKHAETTLKSPELAFQYRGTPITRTFSVPVKDLISAHTVVPAFVPFDWSKPRELVGFFPPAFPNTPDSGKLDPEALPMDIRFTVVVVAPGAMFSGWKNY